MTALRGSCLCGGVRFEIDGPLMRSSHCQLPAVPESAWRAIPHAGAGRRHRFPLSRRQGACLVLRVDAGHAPRLLQSVRRAGAGEIRGTLAQRTDRPPRRDALRRRAGHARRRPWPPPRRARVYRRQGAVVHGHRRPAPIPGAYPRPEHTTQLLTGRSPRLPDSPSQCSGSNA